MTIVSSRNPVAAKKILAAVAATFLAAAALAQPTVADLRCDYRANPLAVDVASPQLSWTLASTNRGTAQTAYQLLVASSREKLAADQGDLWDSGRVPGAATLGIAYAGKTLRSGQACHWKVRVWDEAGKISAWSAPAAWELGLLRPEDWKAQWINDGKPNPPTDDAFFGEDPAPLFRKEFRLAQPVRRARLHIAGLGYYEARLNGGRVGDHLLDPGWTDYRQRVLYSTYDVTAQLRAGSNCLGVALGNGWWNPLPLKMWGRINLRDRLAVGRPRFIAQLEVEFADGTTTRVASDRSWQTTEGPVRFNSIYLGEIYDAQKELPGWDAPGFAAAGWRAPQLAPEKIGPLHAQAQPPIRVTEQFRAVAVTEPKPGVFIYDLGQNFSGWARLRLTAPAGTKIVLRYGELLHEDGSLNPLTSVAGQIKGRRAATNAPPNGPHAPAVAWQTDTYIAKGGGAETYEPRFTFHAFRYLEIVGLTQALPVAAVEGFQLGSDVADAGTFECSNELLNRIQLMCRRTFRANLFSVQSDCPHRERFGYGGDIVGTSEAFILNFDMSTFYRKSVQDWADSMAPDGSLGDTAPSVGLKYCGVGWPLAYPLLVENLHRYYGNKRLVAEQYPGARRWLKSVAAKFPEGIIETGLSDHESLEETPAPQLATPFYYQAIQLVSSMARELGHTNDLRELTALGDKVRAAYQKKFVNPATGRISPGTQGSQAFGLYSGLLPAEVAPRAFDYLVDFIRQEHDGHVAAGIMGTKYMFELLSRHGHAEVAYDMATKTNFPGWGWMLANGATTLWEHWALSRNTFSHNHPMFGSVSQWFSHWLGGIQPAADACGFDRIVIRPQPVPDLQWVKCSYASVRGQIVSNWRRENGRLRFDITIPANTTAQIFIPAAAPEAVRESGRPAAEAPGVTFVRLEQKTAVFAVGSGHYLFESSP